MSDKWTFEDHVLNELSELKKAQHEANDKLNDICFEIAILKFKSGLFGMVAGAIPGAVAAIVSFVNSAH